MDKLNELTKEQKDEDKLFLSKINDKIKFVKARNRVANTEFLDLAQRKMAEDYLHSQKINLYRFYGGYDDAERTMLIIFPEDLPYDPMKNIEKTYSNIMSIIRVELPKEQWSSYEHKTYLGALMKIGLKREKIGDIVVRPDGADIIISNDIKKFLEENLNELTRFQSSKISNIDISEIKYIPAEKKVFKINVPSMRLDAIVGELARVSRADANRLLEEERVFVDFKEEIRGTRQIKEGSFITVRGKGRFQITKILGTTRSGRYSLEVEKPS
jgi:RNA-binding protein YlmH